jgi:hypothetical protein|tara:strand:+ start:2062 stop:2499 length:438 start_codon:yes stop_codon:yes gene_type:complete
MAEKAHDLSDNTRFAMPVRNLISLVVAVGFGVWAYFGIIERLNKIETQAILVQADLVKNTEFRIKWPRGDLGSLPADSEQFMLIEHLAGELDKLSDEIDTGKAPHDQQQALTLQFYEKRISALEEKLESVRDAISELRASNGGTK